MKFASYTEYDPKGIALSIPALVTVWAGIQRYSEELVVVGGLVPHFICRDPDLGTQLPRPATLDVDIGIALGASSGQYGSLSADLQGQGFRPSKKFESRFERVVGNYTIYLDFLVERPPGTKGVVVVDDVPANIVPGIDRALTTARTLVVKGTDLFGAEQSLPIRVCEVGPFLVMKLRPRVASREILLLRGVASPRILPWANGTHGDKNYKDRTRRGNARSAGALQDSHWQEKKPDIERVHRRDWLSPQVCHRDLEPRGVGAEFASKTEANPAL